MSNIVLDANDHTGVTGQIFFFFVPLMDADKDEIVEGLEDLSQAAVVV